MLARRLPSILPPLTAPEALEVTRIHSAVGLRRPSGLTAERPFRAPHHTISASGLIGGGSPPRPGEVTLAHHGVLFLDELSEFARPALEALRQPLEDGRVAVVRGQRTAIFPSRAMLVAATNPCPCGMAGVPGRCRCSPVEHARHRRRLSGPLLDRIDLTVRVDRPTADDFVRPGLHTSARQRERVIAARERQLARLDGTGATCNAHLDAGLSRTHLGLASAGARVLHRAYDKGHLSGRGRLRVLRIARTIADLDEHEHVGEHHVRRAISLHQPDILLDEAS
jgi:magnesium chelatase family protein